MASNLVVGNCADKFYYVTVHSYLEVCTWISNSGSSMNSVNSAKSKSFNLKVGFEAISTYTRIHELCCWYGNGSSAKKLCCGACPEKDFGSFYSSVQLASGFEVSFSILKAK